jgi:UbiD family decarboxylase
MGLLGKSAEGRYADLSFKPNHIKDLRDYIAFLEEHGDAVEVDKEVDLDLEIGAIIRRVNETGSPAPVFTNIAGVAQGMRVMGAPAGVSSIKGSELIRIAASVGLPADASGLDIVEALSHALDVDPIEPRVVDNAPFQANVITGDDIDLNALPAPLLHDGDGGRYLNTWGTIVLKSPDGKWVNWSINRIMITGKNTMSGIVNPGQHNGQLLAEWRKHGKDMPFALSLGHDPVIPFFSGMPLPDHVSEGPVVGGYLKEPVEVAKAHEVDLHVPASSEIVIEGYLSIDEVIDEGPMAEYPGYLLPTARTKKPVYHVTAISHRDQPILPVVVAGYPPEENHTCWGIAIAARVLAELRERKVPITHCYLPLSAALHLLVITVPGNWKELSGGKSRLEFSRELAELVYSLHVGYVIPNILVVRDDIDATNEAEVLWALTTRVHPGEDYVVLSSEPMAPLPVWLKENEKTTMVSAKTVIVGLTRDEWGEGEKPIRADFAHNYPTALQDKVLNNWTEYGFPAETL